MSILGRVLDLNRFSLALIKRVRAERLIMRLIALGCRQFLEVDRPGFAIKDSLVVKAAHTVPSDRDGVQFLRLLSVHIYFDPLGTGSVRIHAEIDCTAGSRLMQVIVGAVSPPHIRVTGDLLEDDVGGFFLFNTSEHVRLPPVSVNFDTTAGINEYMVHIRERFCCHTGLISIDQSPQVASYIGPFVLDAGKHRVAFPDRLMADGNGDLF